MNNPDTSELLPCPFCGVIPTRDKRDGFVRHPYRQGHWCPLNQERDEVFLPSNWNTRAPSVERQPEFEKENK